MCATAAGVLAGLCCVALLVLTLPRTALASEFLGVEIDEERGGVYTVLRDVNMRTKPDTKSKRIRGLKKGEVLNVRGRHQGWLAIEEDSKPVGFAYFKYLIQIIDGTLDKPVLGRVDLGARGNCAYEITFIGKSPAGNEPYDMADYEAALSCDVAAGRADFTLMMFMTEGSYILAKQSVHQIGMDMLEIAYENGYDENFTTNVFYNHAKNRVVFDSVTIKDMAGSPPEKEVDANSVAEALSVAVRMALGAWNDNVWAEIDKLVP